MVRNKWFAATAYETEVNRRLRAFLKESGFEVLGVKGLGIEKVEDVDRVTQDGLLKFCVGVRETQPEGERNSGIVRRPAHPRNPGAAGAAGHIPAISSTPHALWAGVRLLGLSGRAPGLWDLCSRRLSSLCAGHFHRDPSLGDSRRMPRFADQPFPICGVYRRNHSRSAHSCSRADVRFNQVLGGQHFISCEHCGS